MTPERWQKIEELLAAALERAPGERSSFLAQACRGDDALRHEVETLIMSYEQAGDFIEDPLIDGVLGDALRTHANGDGDAAFIGRRLGAYRIVRELGRGGMGAVFLAVRDDDEFQKRVAIKVVKRGMDTDFILRRFRQERQILASLDHPYIARLLDGGTTEDGLPYFVMEYVQGLPVNRYCDAQKLSTPERLRLFLRVCSAVHFAHQNLVIHRDLKPSNVLVTADGTPKLLDFGIAKLLNPEMGGQTFDPTTLAMRLMTPEYASPEQVRGEAVTAASDVYALGVLLYELLTGHRPYRFHARRPEELIRVICEQEPERPSIAVNAIEVLSADGDEPVEITPETVSRVRDGSLDKLRRQLSGSLDNVVLKALRKEPQRRYTSVEEFAADIQRYLDGQPVGASGHVPAATLAKADTGETPTGARAVAVLPFKTLRAEAREDEFLGMGMADAIITKLSNIRRINVRPTSSIIKYFDGEHNALVAGHELGVDYVLDGRIQRVGDRVRVTVQLVRVRDGAPLWAAKFDEKYTDIFSVEDSISEQLARALTPHLTGEERELLQRRETDSPEAYQAYQRGRFFWGKFTDDGFEKARGCFEEAVRLDPAYALAHVGLADYYNWGVIYGLHAPKDGFPRAKAAALRALELDETLAEAHAALAFTHLCFDWDRAAAEARFRRALELNPGSAPAHHWYANLLAATGRFDEAVREARRAQELTPLSLMEKSLTGWFCYQARRYEQAAGEAQKALEMDANFANALHVLGCVFERTGRYEEAVALSRRAIDLMGGTAFPLAFLGYTLAAAGRRDEAFEVLAKLKRLAGEQYVSPYFMALVNVGLGDHDEAFAWLERACEARDEWLIWLGTEPKLDRLRNDPRYNDLLGRVGLMEAEVASRIHQSATETINIARDPSGGHAFAPAGVGVGPRPSGQFQPGALGVTEREAGPGAGRGEAPSRRRPGRRAVVAAALAVVLVAACGYGLYRYFGRTPASASFRNTKSTKLTNTGNAGNAAVSPDGKYVVYSLEEGGRQSLWIRQVSVANSLRIVAPAEVAYRGLTFSRDGAHVYYVAAERGGRPALYQVPALGGAARKVKDGVDSGVDFSPDGRQFAFVRRDAERGEDYLVIADTAGGAERAVATRRFPAHFAVASPPAWSPGEQLIAVVVEGADEAGFHMEPVGVRFVEGVERPLSTERWLDVGQMAWLPDSSGLIMTAQGRDSSFLQLWSLPYPRGEARRLVSDLADYRGVSMPAAADSLVTVHRQILTNVWLAPKDKPGGRVQINSGAGRYVDLSWTPDGKIIYASDTSGIADIWEMNADGTEQRQLTAAAGRNYAPTASPDGRHILFHSSRTGRWQIWRMDRDGGNAVQLTNEREDSNWPQVSPDGRWVIYEHIGAGSTVATLWRMPFNGGATIRLTNQLSARAAISPDGQLVAYWQKEQRPNAPWRIAVVRLADGVPVTQLDVPQSLTNANTSLHWTHDSRAILFLDFSDGATTLWQHPIDGGAPQKLAAFPNEQIYSFDLFRDGQIVFSRGLRTNDVVLITDSK